jgi:two-component system, chemotaxis family, CheB/CheR fusion protein
VPRPAELARVVDAEIAGIGDAIDVPILVVGADGTLVRFNRGAREALGLVPSDIGRRPGARGGGARGALAGINDLDAQCARAIADDVTLRRDVRLGDRQFLLRLAPYRGAGGLIAGVVLTFTNVTAFRASLDKAVYEREYTKAILNTVTIPLVVLDAQLHVQSANRAFYDLFSLSRDQVVGVPLRAHGDDAWQTSPLWTGLERMLGDHSVFEPLTITREFARLGQRTLLLEAGRVALEDDSAILLAFQDITSLRDADRRKDEFLALLSHELRNPLAPIRTALELIRVSGDTPQSVERVRGMMERQVAQMTRLVDDLLDVSRITTGKIALQRSPTALRELVERAIEEQRAEIDAARIELTLDLPEAPCVIDVDPARFVQILSNILHNATKFTPPRGAVRVRAELLTTTPPPRVAVTVSDTGEGIAKELLPHVFDLFVQAEAPVARAHGGLGIGLALARRLVEMHGGEIAGYSDGPGLGSAFVVTMPLAAGAASRGPTPPRDVAPVAGRIVVIDDNADAATSLAMLVEQLGGTARVAHDGERGLEVVRDFAPDVVFLDIGMPRVDGYEVCRRIRGEPSARPVIIIAVTGWGQAQDKQRALDAGFDAHLTKPVDPVVLERMLAGWSPRQRV